MKTLKIDWKKTDGLVPAIVQDAATQQVLMLGYMDEAALKKTLQSKRVTFFSRTKQRLWTKGESSGNFLRVKEIEVDCDNDTLLIQAQPDGPTCHRGTISCFGAGGARSAGFLAQLDSVIAQRLSAGGRESYTARLADEGLGRVAQKVGEEGVETALAAVSGSKAEFAGEAADLIYHLMVLLRVKKLSLQDAITVLSKRHAPAAAASKARPSKR